MKNPMLLLMAIFSATTLFAQQKVLVMDIKDVIDPRMHRYVDLALREAGDIKADIVIIEMDTYGGILCIRDRDERVTAVCINRFKHLILCSYKNICLAVLKSSQYLFTIEIFRKV